jgi:hypothetical protein
MFRLALFAFLFALPVAAQERMTAAEFEAFTEGKTLFYAQGGEVYGAEIHHRNRRVSWSFLDGQCRAGRWYAEDGLICFVYETDPAPQCWSFVRQGDRLIARFRDDPATGELYEARETGEPLLCPGPRVGV